MPEAFYISDFTEWIPPAGEPAAAPKLEWTEPIFRRRLSQLTKMTVQVTHDLFEKAASPETKKAKIIFASLRGEIDREFKINKTLIEDNSVLPAAFSLSTFNAPIAQATIALGLKGGYTAIYPCQAGIQTRDAFKNCLLAAASPILSGKEERIIFVYADEYIPECYEGHHSAENYPLAFAAVFSSQKMRNSVEYKTDKIPESPKAFSESINNANQGGQL